MVEAKLDVVAAAMRVTTTMQDEVEVAAAQVAEVVADVVLTHQTTPTTPMMTTPNFSLIA